MKNEILNAFDEAIAAAQTIRNNNNCILKIEEAATMMIRSLKNKGRIFSCGNGGSMTDAMHFAEELTGRFRKNRTSLAAIAISDPAHISCVANDFGYEHIFSKYLEGNGAKGDCLLAISTSGNSPNVLNAARMAQSIGIKVVCLTGKNDSALEKIADISVATAIGNFSDRVQEIHGVVIHILVELTERELFPENYRD